MSEAYYHPDVIHYRNMSQRQRHGLLREKLKLPKHLEPIIKANDTELVRMFNQGYDLMVRGKVPFSPEALQTLLDQIDAARWATPKPEVKE